MEKQVKVSRIFDAPVEEVWKLWSVAEYVKQWWGPDKFTCPTAKIHFGEGETSLVSMQAPNEFGGQTHYNIWTYKKIVPLESIEFIQNLSDEKGNKVKPTAVGMPPDFPEDVRTLVTFKNLGNEKTEMTVTEFADFGQISHFAQMGLEQSIGKAAALFVAR
ncbi:MAG: activator of HSP90 ATPase [Bacteroidetes bacterium]|nr:MAG: activator of HSP90 ATPase [Bacteroidota bacterium]